MKPELRPRVGREERRQAAREVRVHELLDAALADVGELGDGDRRGVERERDRLAVEVAAADHLVAVGPSTKTSGLSVDDRGLALEHAARERRARRASRRGPAACSAASTGPGPCRSPCATRRSREPASSARRNARDGDLAGVRARGDDARVERARRALERLERQRAGDVGDRGRSRRRRAARARRPRSCTACR